jgi:hypothetical protein
MLKKGLLFGLTLSLAAAMACGGDSSKTPVSPTPASTATAEAAADGSTLKVTAPQIVLPATGTTIESITPNLVINPATARFVTTVAMVYRFAVESQSGAEVYRSGAVTDAGTGLIAQRVPDSTLTWSTTYRWRARAESGTTVGPWMSYATFVTPPEPAPPTLNSPANGARANSVAPNLVVNNGALPAGSSTTGVEHRFVVETPGGTVVTTGTAPNGATTTTFAVPADALQPETSYRWRARAERGSAFIGPWSPYWTFTTPSPQTWPTTPDGVVAFVAGKYPEYMGATNTLHERESNMEFIRDRMIEAGICGGLDLAWNLKRGVGPRSTDALLFRDGSRDRVIDIAAGFDEYRVPMRLHWIEVEGPPGYDQFLPRPSCK